jgi:hypothetical protein
MEKKKKMPNVTPIPQQQTANQQMTAIYMNRLQEEISSGKKKQHKTKCNERKKKCEKQRDITPFHSPHLPTPARVECKVRNTRKKSSISLSPYE